MMMRGMLKWKSLCCSGGWYLTGGEVGLPGSFYRDRLQKENVSRVEMRLVELTYREL